MSLGHLDAFGQACLKQAVDDLFRGPYFDICKFDEIQRLGRFQVDQSIYQQLRTLHCVHYDQMPREIKSQLQQKVVQCLRGDIDFAPSSAVFAAIAAEGSNFVPGLEDEQGQPSFLKRLGRS